MKPGISFFTNFTVIKTLIPAKSCIYFDEKDITHSYLEQGSLRVHWPQRADKQFHDFNYMPANKLTCLLKLVKFDNSRKILKRYALTGNEMAVLYCIGMWKKKPQSVSLISFDGDYILQPSNSVLLMDGFLKFTDGQEYIANKLNCIKERDYQLVLTGKAKMIQIAY